MRPANALKQLGILMAKDWTTDEINRRVSEAVKAYWKVRAKQHVSRKAGDTGSRSEVTGGKHLNAFIKIFEDVAKAAGYGNASATSESVIVPGYYRPTKKWDLAIHDGGRLIAALELKSQVGPSFGNNFNNRSEEAIGNSADFWRAFKADVFGIRPPWLGYFLLVEDHQKSRSAVKLPKTVVPVLSEFHGTSYQERYAILLGKLMTDRQYTSTAYIVSPRGKNGHFSTPNDEMSVARFVKSLLAHLMLSKG